MSDGVQVAIVSGGFTVICALIGWAARVTKRDHGETRDTLGRIESKIDTHINDHARGDV